LSLSVRRAATSVAATAVVLTLAACGGDDKATDTSSSAASSSASASSSSDTTPSAAAGGELSAEQFGTIIKTALDKATTAHVSMDLGGSGTAEGDADWTKSPPEMTMTMSMAQLGGDVEARLVDGTMYMKGATFGDKWIAIPMDDPNSPLGALGGSLDVTKSLEQFAAAVTSVKDLGHETVDGDSLEHYSTTVDRSKLLEQLPSAAAGAAGSLPKTLDQDWWFDSDGLIRQFSFGYGSTPLTFKLSNWGEDVSIEAPPSDQVTSMPSMGSGGA
jgi:hypothetical protein